jgi:hypothetical protein
MHGIRYVIDEKGRKEGVLIDLKKHGAIWEQRPGSPKPCKPSEFAR